MSRETRRSGHRRFTNGRTTESEDGYSVSMTPGAYTHALEGTKNLWTDPDVSRIPIDQVVETTIAEMSGHQSQIAGVVCRGDVDKNKGYGFFIGLDGYYSIGTVGADGARLVANKRGNARTDAVDPDGTNTVRAECTSGGKTKVRLTLTMNDEEVVSVVDRTSPSKIGRWGYLITEVRPGEMASTTFSSFRIAGPDDQATARRQHAMGLFKKNEVGVVPVPGQATLNLAAGKLVVDYDEERKGRSTSPTAANRWKGIPDGVTVALVAADGGPPIVVEQDPIGRSWAGTRRAGSRYGTVEIPTTGTYTVRVDPFAVDRELHDPRIVLKR